MKHLLTIHEADVFPGAQDLDPKDFSERRAARAVVLNNTHQVALLKANTYKYHKLPGGGIEDGEDVKAALKRELVEEIGCNASVISDIGEIIEYRDKWRLRQTSHCYLAEQVGEQKSPSFYTR